MKLTNISRQALANIYAVRSRTLKNAGRAGSGAVHEKTLTPR
jgi:hypothetical protein